MANLRIVPAAQISTFKISNVLGGPFDLRVAGDVTTTGGVDRKKRTAIEDAHTPQNVYVEMHNKGVLTVTFLADQDMAFLDSIVDGIFSITLLNGKILTLTGVTQATEDGGSTIHTTGLTNEQTFGYNSIQQRTPTS
jgi:hypothetical protein